MQNVEVMASFGINGKVSPKAFKHGFKTYYIKQVNLSHSIKRGAGKVLVFSVSDDVNNWTLLYDSENLLWQIDDFTII